MSSLGFFDCATMVTAAGVPVLPSAFNAAPSPAALLGRDIPTLPGAPAKSRIPRLACALPKRDPALASLA